MTRSEYLCLTKGTRVKVQGKDGVVVRINGGDMEVFVEFSDGSDWKHFTHVHLLALRKSEPIQPAEALQAINRYRRAKARRKLDPVESQWTHDDLLTEYDRLVSIGAIKT